MRKKIFGNLFILSVVFFCILGFVANTAKAYGGMEEGFYTFSSALDENKALDIQWCSEELGANLQIYDKNNSAAQVFYVSRANDGYYEIKAVCSGYVLDVSYGQAFCGANVWQWGENGTDAQRWAFEFVGDNTVNIKSKLGDYYLDVDSGRTNNETNVRLWGWNGTLAQSFKLKKLDMETSGTVSEKIYPQRRLIKLKDRFLSHYKQKNCKNVLLISRDKFFNDFKAAFKSGLKFNVDRVSNLDEIGDTDKYDMIINEKYDTRFLKTLIPDKEIESFRSLYRKIICEAAIDYLKSNDIPIYFFRAPHHSQIKELGQVDRELLSAGLTDLDTIKNSGLLDKIFGDAETCKKYFTSGECSRSFNVIKVRNHSAVADFKGKYCNIIGHARYVPSAPKEYRNSIYLYGPCTMRSKYVSDEYTISNFMQKRINKDFGGLYNVVSYGCEDVDESNDFEYILDTTFKPGDIVVEERDFSDSLKDIIRGKGYCYRELSEPINKQRLTNFLVNDITHLNHRGCKMAADFIYDTIKGKIRELLKRNFEDRIIKFDYKDRDESFIKENPDFKPYLEHLEKISKPYRKKYKTIGSLNVNCNPFTRGHRYLIEEALKRVDHLFLFVVEEDASEFSFADRYEMVKRGIADLGDRITLLTTGKWMCSRFTFPDYFDKDNLQSKVILNPTKDVDLYGAYIAPAIGATRRFFGEEPIDKVTQQHNNFMKRQLPEYGIEVIEIPRKTLDSGQVISASKVRKNLKEKNWEALEKLVPQTTYDYLKENYERIIKRLS